MVRLLGQKAHGISIGSALLLGLMFRIDITLFQLTPAWKFKLIGVFAMILDQSNDGAGVGLHSMTKLYNVPEFVKSASTADITGQGNNLAPNVYGDTRTLRFPCHSSPATYVSMSYFLDQEQSLGKVASAIKTRILKAADYFGIRADVDSLVEKHAALRTHSENDLSDSDFAMVVNFENGNKTRSYPLRNSNEVKAAADWIEKFAGDINFYDRKVISTKILEKASEYGVKLDNDDTLNKLAANGLVSRTKAANMLFDRAKALKTLRKDSDIQTMLAKTAQHVLETSDADLDKAASIIELVDREYKLKSLGSYSDLYSLSVKQASEALDSHVQLTNGSVYKKAALESIALDELRSVFGEEFTDRVSSGGLLVDSEKLAEELTTLPRKDAGLFDKLVDSLGVKTAYKKASFDAVRVEDFIQ
jgi:hypothetical protein